MYSRKIVVALIVLSIFGIGFCPISIARNRDSKSTSSESTLDDQTDIALAIYNCNLGLVKDERQIKVSKGISSLRFIKIAP